MTDGSLLRVFGRVLRRGLSRRASKDFSGWVDDLRLIEPALLAMDARIEHVRFHPNDFRDENPLVWEIKKSGIQLVGSHVVGG